MIRAEIDRDRSLSIVEATDPVPGRGEVLVDVSYCGICGSDLHMRVDERTPPGTVLGHEFSGVIRSVGPEAEGWAAGDRVAVLPYDNCGSCEYCMDGHHNLCVTGGHLGNVHGVTKPGGLSSSVVVGVRSLVRVPEGLDLAAAALTEPLAVAVRAARRAQAHPHAGSFVVIGAGPIGLLVGLVLRSGGGRPMLVERNVSRRDRARALGLEVAESLDLGDVVEARGISVIVDCTGVPAVIGDAVRASRRRGRIVLVGLPPIDVPIGIERLILHEIELVGSAGYARSDFEEAIELLAAGRIPHRELITRIVPLRDADLLFRQLEDPSSNSDVKVLVDLGVTSP